MAVYCHCAAAPVPHRHPEAEQIEPGTEAAASQADIRLQAALDRHAGWQLEYDIMLIRADRKRLLGRITELASTCDELNAAYAAETAKTNDRDRLAARVAELETVLREILGTYWEKGHVGYAATRTQWFREERLETWRYILAGIPKPD